MTDEKAADAETPTPEQPATAHGQVNGSPPTPQQLAAAWNEALAAYSQGLMTRLQQGGSQLNPFDMMVQANLTALRLNVLLGYLNYCGETKQPFSTAEYDAHAVAALTHAAQAVAQPQILRAGAPHPRRQ